MRIVYKEAMSKKKKPRHCLRCGEPIPQNSPYFLLKGKVLCQGCLREEEYISGIRYYKNRYEKFHHHGALWNISAILEEIERGRIFPQVTLPLQECIKANQGIFIDRDKLPSLSLEQPGILGLLPNGQMEILDGHHRMQRRFELDEEGTMQFYVLTFREMVEFLLLEERELEWYVRAHEERGE